MPKKTVTMEAMRNIVHGQRLLLKNIWELGNSDIANVADSKIKLIYELVMALHDAKQTCLGAEIVDGSTPDFSLDEIYEAEKVIAGDR